ncbi:glycosyltransferase family 2 protein [Schleiferilactobacillus shenzhenensis]|uniref:Putative glycosyltransferase n=1 Tax=Schleiferilactobacillus shenzhenensis LY-73 TaxID=1231336 RepID=U4TJH6_9LACO|nr:glycosyltransferase family A protein [Schleiferilactobacillus shenzhenensis]ERL64349.1 putative glycosyltransferase [Schleiferilactobacillus shenzhenensis LY-73]
MAPLISIIVPAYNLDGLLNRSVQALLQQTYRNIEVLIMDDGSTDDTYQIATEFARLDDRVRVLQMPANVGISRTRNAGMAAARGDFLTFSDGDDWTEPTQMAWYMDRFAKHPEAAMVACGFVIEPTGRRNKSRKHGIVDQKEMLNLVAKPSGPIRGYTWNKCYRTDIIQDHHLTFDADVKLMEDALFNTRYCMYGDQFYIENTPLYHYVQREGSAIHAGVTVTKKARDIMVVNARMQQIITEGRERQAKQDKLKTKHAHQSISD